MNAPTPEELREAAEELRSVPGRLDRYIDLLEAAAQAIEDLSSVPPNRDAALPPTVPPARSELPTLDDEEELPVTSRDRPTRVG